ncbi:MAG: hypothetical protein RJB66_843 [Pseudomonadota bacterium]|jgi:hypothetical protein
MKRLFLIVSVLFCGLPLRAQADGACDNKRALVFVPSGLQKSELTDAKSVFFPLSPAIRSTFSRVACHWMIANAVDSKTTLKENGRLALEQILKWHSADSDRRELPIEVIAHGIGGLFALEAISLNQQQDKKLSFEKAHLISTPLRGLELANILKSNLIVRDQLTLLFETNYPSFKLGRTFDYTSEKIEEFLSSLNLPSSLELNTYSGTQAESKAGNASENEYTHLSSLLSGFSFLIENTNDGLISRRSALSTFEQSPAVEKNSIKIVSHPDMHLNLDHFEQVTDPRHLKGISRASANKIELRQREFFESLLTN